MKLKTADLTRISQRLTTEGITEVDVFDNRLIGTLVSGATETIVSIFFIVKADLTPGLKVLKTVKTKSTILNEEP